MKKSVLSAGLICLCAPALAWTTNDWQFLETIERANLRFFQLEKKGPYNLLNDTAEESLATETLMTETVFSPTFGQPVSFVDPRRAMIGIRLNLGR